MDRSDGPIRVIFLDQENAVRSQMAEALLRRLGGATYEVHSGGIAPQPVHPFTYTVMREIGYDLDHQAGKSAQVFFGRGGAFHVAILVSHPEEQECPRLFPGALRVERWANRNPLLGDQDPAQLLERFRKTRDHLLSQAEAWLKLQKDSQTSIFARKAIMVGAH